MRRVCTGEVIRREVKSTQSPSSWCLGQLPCHCYVVPYLFGPSGCCWRDNGCGLRHSAVCLPHSKTSAPQQTNCINITDHTNHTNDTYNININISTYNIVIQSSHLTPLSIREPVFSYEPYLLIAYFHCVYLQNTLCLVQQLVGRLSLCSLSNRSFGFQYKLINELKKLALSCFSASFQTASPGKSPSNHNIHY